MYSTILIGVLIFEISSVESSNQAISSMSFHREDVPLSYKYSSVHIYNTERPSKRSNYQSQDHSHADAPRNIQYAPLISIPENNNINDARYTDALTQEKYEVKDQGKQEELVTKKILEPQVTVPSVHQRLQPVRLIGGHNIDVEPKVNIGYSSLDLGYPNNYLLSDIYNQYTPRNPNIQSYQNLFNVEQPTTKNSAVNGLTKSPKLHELLLARHYNKQAGNLSPVLSALETSKIQPVFNPYVKVPQLHINVARAYNFARLPNKASERGHQIILGSNPKQAILLEENTFLYPLQNKYHRSQN